MSVCVCVYTHTHSKSLQWSPGLGKCYLQSRHLSIVMVCVCLKLEILFSPQKRCGQIFRFSQLRERKSPEGGVFQFSQLMFCPFYFFLNCSDQHTLEQFLERGHPFLITKTVGARGQLKLYICEHSKKSLPWSFTQKPLGRVHHTAPASHSVCGLLLHRRLCLRTQKLPAYTTSQVTPLSGLGLTAALPQQSDVAFLRLHFKVHLLRNNNTRF